MLRPNGRIAAAFVVLMVAIAMARIGSTWRRFTETMDEAYYIACGMQWLSTGNFTYETQNPPLAKVVAAVGPYFSGARFHNLPNAAEEGRAILDEAPDYFGMLARARAGNLLFFLAACGSVWLLARQCGSAVACASVALFVCVPVVLGHAGMATTDMAVAGCVPLAFWSWRCWIAQPDNPKLAALAGFTTGLAAVSKFSAIVFLPVALLVLLVFRRYNQTAARWKPSPKTLAWATLAFVSVCWAAYRFTLLPVRTPPGRQFLLLDHMIGATGRMHGLVYRLLEVPLPLTAMVKGLGEVFQHNWDGHPAYLFGHVSQHGWWYFFPVVLAIKTPLAFMVLAGFGAAVSLRERSLPVLECLLAAAAVVLVAMLSNVNIGVRYVLAVYPLLAPAAGLGAVWMWKRSRPAAAALCLWMLAGSVAAHPNYLADFNLLAGSKPERIVTDSDLDWGQDLHIATETLQRRGVSEAWIAYSGQRAPERETGIVYRELAPNTRVTGWVVASVRKLYFESAKARASAQPGPYDWLEPWQPAMRAGRSILIYDLTGAPK